MMKNKTLRSTCSLLACLSIVLTSIVPINLAFALSDHCGPHEIEICDEHGQSHFKLTHKEQQKFSEKTPRPSSTYLAESLSNFSHNHDHHIESSQPQHISRSDTSIGAQVWLAGVVAHFFAYRNPINPTSFVFLEPPENFSNTLLLKNVRLII